MFELLDPTNETRPSHRPRTVRPTELRSLTIGLLDIAKRQGDLFLDEIERQLDGQGVAVKRYQKPTYARPASAALQQQIALECDLVIEGLAD